MPVKTNPLLKLFSVAVIDQALLSAANFLVAMALIRTTELKDYGYFVLVQVSIALAVTGQGALLGGPLSIVGPKKVPETRDQMLAKVDRARRRFLRFAGIAVLPIPALGYWLGLWKIELMWLGLAGIAAGIATLTREFYRMSLLVQSRPQILLRVDIVYVVLLFTFMGAALYSPGETYLWAVLALALASIIGAIYNFQLVGLASVQGESEEAQGIWKDVRRLGSWSTVGAIIYWIQSQSFNYLLAARLAVEAVAHVNAARLLMMPAFLLSNGVSGLLVPSAAGWIHHEGLRKLLRRLSLFFLIILVLDLCYFAFLWLTRDFITEEILSKVIEDRDFLILLWGLIVILGLARDISQAAVLAMEKIRTLAFFAALGAVTSLVTMVISIGLFGPPGAIIGVGAGELVYLCGISCVLVFALRSGDGEVKTEISGTGSPKAG